MKQQEKPLMVLAEELVKISSDVAKGLLSIVIPQPSDSKPRWCQCMKCGAWHRLAP